ncbi:hypothetical protein D1872_303810 [compost metagenome]
MEIVILNRTGFVTICLCMLPTPLYFDIIEIVVFEVGNLQAVLSTQLMRHHLFGHILQITLLPVFRVTEIVD